MKKQTYTPKTNYTNEQLDSFALADLLSDAESAEHQAEHGPYYLDKGITKETLQQYAKTTRNTYEKYKQGGAHFTVINGE